MRIIKNIPLVIALLWCVIFWMLVGYAVFHLLGCAHNEIDLTLVPDIIPKNFK